MAVTSPRSSVKGNYTPAAPLFWGDVPEWCRKIAEVVNALRDGKLAASGTITLTANQASSTLTDPRIGATSRIMFMPTTANAAAAVSGMYVSAKGDGTATITHANNAQTDRTFDYAIVGVS